MTARERRVKLPIKQKSRSPNEQCLRLRTTAISLLANSNIVKHPRCGVLNKEKRPGEPPPAAAAACH